VERGFEDSGPLAMSITIGTQFGSHEIIGLLGKGGMGEVYRARDAKLKREVAIKILPDEFSSDPDRLNRFQNEAEVLASLNHPNIAAIYDLQEARGTRFLVLELVEGETLAERLRRGAIPLDEALDIAKRIGEALEAAHDKGIVHRDLKPANVKITPDGTVKVLDFGLAKAREIQAAASMSDSPTLASVSTPGVILGTAAYMSPEQARGKPVDRRTDIWAFGVVLYEMVTGRRLFEGEDVTETIAAVVKEQPDWTPVPSPVRRLLKSCLEKDPKKRLQAIGDMRLLLDDAASQAASSPRPRFGKAAWAVAGVAVLAAAALAFIHFREQPPDTPVVRSTILLPQNTTVDFTAGVGLLSLSPDGRRIVFGARTTDGKTPLWVRSLDGLTAQPLTGTEGATFPFWSPDSRFIAFFADGKLKKIDASGGPVLTLADAAVGRGGSWSRQGVIVFAPTNNPGLMRVSAAGGVATPISAEMGSFPFFLPDGQHFLYQQITASGSFTIPIRLGSLDGSTDKAIGSAGSNPLYAQGHLLFLREGTLMAQPFDTQSLMTTGEAVPVAEQVQTVLGSGRAGAFSVSETGLLAYQEGSRLAGTVLTWFDRIGKQGTTIGDPVSIISGQGGFRFSPDRKRLAAVIQDRSGSLDIWIYDVGRGLRTRFTFDATTDDNPVWSPDGRTIIFRSSRKGSGDLYRKAVDSVGAEELFYADNSNKAPTSWSPDGKLLLYTVVSTNGNDNGDIWGLPLAPEPTGTALKPFPVVQTPFNEGSAAFSPDGRWIAYVSNESRRNELYVTSFPAPSSGPAGKRQVSTGGIVFRPRWRDDGKEILYLSPDFQLMSAEVTIKGATVEIGAVRSLFSIPRGDGFPAFDVTADGQRFLFRAPPEERSGQQPLTLIQNWPTAAHAR
jgi:eukaryotic-like serine/threonine-protein kinase